MSVQLKATNDLKCKQLTDFHLKIRKRRGKASDLASTYTAFLRLNQVEAKEWDVAYDTKYQRKI